MEFVAQSVRASVCGTEGRGFEPHLSPKRKGLLEKVSLFSLLVCFVVSRGVDGATFRFEPHNNVFRTTCPAFSQKKGLIENQAFFRNYAFCD